MDSYDWIWIVLPPVSFLIFLSVALVCMLKRRSPKYERILWTYIFSVGFLNVLQYVLDMSDYLSAYFLLLQLGLVLFCY